MSKKTDLFENIESQPEELRSINEFYEDKMAVDGLNYSDCDKWLLELKEIGYKFSYGLDAVPYNLVSI